MLKHAGIGRWALGGGLVVAYAVAIASGALVGAQGPSPYDLIIRHGTVIDGTGGPRYAADVAITGGTIAKVGDLAGTHATADIDATGLFVAPGFINIHSHPTLEGLRTADNMLTQGVTLELLNPDGGGPIDVADELQMLKANGLAVNVGAYIGFNSVWAKISGEADRRPSAGEIAGMQAAIERGLEQGAWGVSAGLDYKPAYYATVDEVVRAVAPASKWRTIFTNHDRLAPESNYSSRAGIAETIAIGESAGLEPVVTHMKVQGHEQGSAVPILGLLTAATARGHYTAADAYPYLAGQTSLAALIIPGWAQDGGRDAMLKRFADPALRERIVKESEQAMALRFGGPQGVYLPETREELVAVMRGMNVGAGEAVIRVLEKAPAGAILRFGAEADLVKILQYPATSIACDCGAVAKEAAHPRFYGTFPRVLGRYVREQHALTWEEAVRKMTGLPAATIGMADRGLLAPGMRADITVFDPKTVIDHATYEEPMREAEGIRFVLIDGRLALRDGRPTGERAGQPLVRDAHQPSRPMATPVVRRLSLSGTIAGSQARVTLAVEQAPGERAAHGVARLTDPASKVGIDMMTYGVLQTAGEWASFTGRAALRPGVPEQSILVIVDRGDGAGTRFVSIDAGATYRVAGSVTTNR